MKRKFLFITAIISILVLVFGSAACAYAASSYDYNGDEEEEECGDTVTGAVGLGVLVFIYYMFKFIWNIVSNIIYWTFGGVCFIFTGRWPEKPEKLKTPIELPKLKPTQKLKPMDKYLDLDPEFDEEGIKNLISNLYVQLQDARQAKDLSPLRPYMTDALYTQTNRQLEELRKNHQTEYSERIAVLNIELKGWRQSGGRDYITVGLNTRAVLYTLDDVTEKVIAGHKEREKFTEYEIELSRKKGSFTRPEAEGVKSDRCPHCGAPIKLNASAKCEYCGSVITSVNTNWAICSMKVMSQKAA
ncbi:MAG: TIM44-like domain-containing protein [Synergistaceae bacterium]|nr:TIM44-like domain-containing protein [Synergistaceae bacterium]